MGTWDTTAQQYESDVFFAEFSHSESSENRTFKIKIGSGGNIYSFNIESIGEIMPPQVHNGAPWIDEVWQCVAVNGGLAHTEDMSWFIHQAGAYQRDGLESTTPFYSPNLARRCEDNACSFVSWGQQAHVPTNWTSEAIYMTRYTDCGEGVMEVEYMIHNFGESLVFDYNNVPWGGVRTSVLRGTRIV
jgi:hypothetical protein